MDGPAIELRGLCHRYDTSPVLRDIDLAIERGEIFGFLGHNGAGKTTAVNILTTLIVPTSGRRRCAGSTSSPSAARSRAASAISPPRCGMTAI